MEDRESLLKQSYELYKQKSDIEDKIKENREKLLKLEEVEFLGDD